MRRISERHARALGQNFRQSVVWVEQAAEAVVCKDIVGLVETSADNGKVGTTVDGRPGWLHGIECDLVVVSVRQVA